MKKKIKFISMPELMIALTDKLLTDYVLFNKIFKEWVLDMNVLRKSTGIYLSYLLRK